MRPDHDSARGNSRKAFDSNFVFISKTSESPFPRDLISSLISRTFFLKAYLDALPGMVERGVKFYMLSRGQLLGEASGPDETLMDEVCLNFRQRHGEEFCRNFLGPVQFGSPDPIDLKRYRYYYHPEEDQRN
jgi:hypothetical protein